MICGTALRREAPAHDVRVPLTGTARWLTGHRWLDVGTIRPVHRRRGTRSIVALLAVLLAGCGSEPGPETTTWRLDPHTGAPSRSLSPSAVVRGEIGPGRVVTTIFRPAVTFELPDAWQVWFEGPGFILISSDQEEGSDLMLARRTGMLVAADPRDVPAGPTVVPIEMRPVDRRGPLAELRNIPDVAVSPVPDIVVAGEPRPAFLARSTVPGQPTDPCDATNCRSLPSGGEERPFYLLAPQEAVIVIDLPEEDLWVILGDFTRGPDAARVTLEPVLASLAVDPS
jgi:hypothetical protein